MLTMITITENPPSKPASMQYQQYFGAFSIKFSFRNLNATVLWDETAIEVSLRHFVLTTFGLQSDQPSSFLDTIETVVLQNSSQVTKWTQSEKNAILLWASWKSQVTLMASVLSNGAEVSATDQQGFFFIFFSFLKVLKNDKIGRSDKPSFGMLQR